MSLLLAAGITAGYGRAPVIQDVTVRADPGTTVGIIGPNGSGKSTLLKAVMGLITLTAGQVVIADQNVTGWPTHRIVRHGLGYIPQLNNVFPSLTVLENLEMGALPLQGHKKGPRIDQVLAEFPALAAARRKRAYQLSGGQSKLLAVARALMSDPKVVLADEPTSGLSPINAELIWQQLTRIAGGGLAVIVVEQNVQAALTYCDWCYVLLAGKNRLDGSVNSIKEVNLDAIFLGAADQSEQRVASEKSS